MARFQRDIGLLPRQDQRLLGHAPALDGLRGIAVALIVVFHFAGHHVLHGAAISLDVFFALSGFLITALILDERRVTGRLDLLAFSLRRACRLLPALFAMLGIWCVLLLLFHDQGWMGSTPAGDGSGSPVEVGPALKAVGGILGYGANWDIVNGGMAAPLHHLWSLSVEEQFYVLWPGLLLGLLTLSLRWRNAILVAAIGASVTWANVLWLTGSGNNRIYFGTDTRAASLLLGALAALVWHRRRSLGRRHARVAGLRAYGAAGLFVVVLLQVRDDMWRYTVVPAVVALLMTQVMPYVVDVPRSLLARGMAQRGLVWLGQRSYGLYLWHYLWATWTHGLPLGIAMPFGIGGALLCTVLSWRFVEQPALGWLRTRRSREVAVRPSQRPQRVAMSA